jgi:hypothetical protein
MSTRDQFRNARAYIDAEDYQSARRILRQIDHPQATEWLQRIDQLDPRGSQKTLGYILGALSLVATFIAIFAFIAIVANPANALIGAFALLIAIPVAYITRRTGKNLRS